MNEAKIDPKLWVTVTLAVAVIGCLGLLGASVVNILPELLRAQAASAPAYVPAAAPTAVLTTNAPVLTGPSSGWLPTPNEVLGYWRLSGGEGDQSRVTGPIFWSNQEKAAGFSSPPAAEVYTLLEQWGRTDGNIIYTQGSDDCSLAGKLTYLTIAVDLFENTEGAEQYFQWVRQRVDRFVQPDSTSLAGDTSFLRKTTGEMKCAGTSTSRTLQVFDLEFRRYNVVVSVLAQAKVGPDEEQTARSIVTQLAQKVDLKIVTAGK